MRVPQALVGYSEQQLQDMLAVRRLFFGQIGRLLKERESLIDCMFTHSNQLSNVRIWAERLQQNIAEEHEMYVQNLAASYLGVSFVMACCTQSRLLGFHLRLCYCCHSNYTCA